MEFQRKSKEKRFGLSYMGSKSRFWKWLLQRIPACGTFYDLFAGGKDSQTVYHLAEAAGVEFEAVYSATTIDPPEVVRFIRKQYA